MSLSTGSASSAHLPFRAGETSAQSSDAVANTLFSVPTPAILSRWQASPRRGGFSEQVCKDQRPPCCHATVLRCTSGLLG
ncbi:hypothetical protein MRX96_020208 [Rhipicephalus microplus]